MRAVQVLLLVGAAALLALYGSSRRARPQARRPAAARDLFDKADADGDGLLSRREFRTAVELAEADPDALDPLLRPDASTPTSGASVLPASKPAASVPAASTVAASTHASGSAAPQSVQEAALRAAPLPQCSLLFFWHIVKTAGTTMRTILQRNAQLGDFEYLYTDTTKKPRWQLLMHQLSQNVTHRRIIVELHSEWGLGRDFHEDIAQLRALYGPLGCRVTVATVVRQAISFHLAWFNWRASNYMPLCSWDPPLDPISRQLVGFGLPFVTPSVETALGGRKLRIPPAAVLSHLDKYDVVGTTERFDETLLVLSAASGIRHLGYARLAENQKPKHPKLAKAVLASLLADTGVPSTSVAFAPTGANVSWGPPSAADASPRLSVRWSARTLSAMDAYAEESMRSALSRPLERGKPPKADCMFYPCKAALTKAKGYVDRAQCEGVTPRELLDEIVHRTHTDTQVHTAAVAKLDAAVARLRRESTTSIEAQLADLRASSADVQARRSRELKDTRLCGVRLCGEPLRSCVGCAANPVPPVEECWPSWEDQFSPDERRLYCKRSSTFPG